MGHVWDILHFTRTEDALYLHLKCALPAFLVKVSEPAILTGLWGECTC
jgi:hypothetical protein